MDTITFTSIPRQGIITIPEEYREQVQGQIRVFVIKEHTNASGEILLETLDKVFEKYKNVMPFNDIDPVEWQREQRHEWQSRVTR